jgi:hypothetical protein
MLPPTAILAQVLKYSSSPEDTGGRMCDHSSRSTLGQATMVCPTTKTVSGGASMSTIVAESSEATSIQPVPQRSRGVQPSRLEVVQQAHTTKGFSEKVAERMARAQKESSLQVYESKWRNSVAGVRNGIEIPVVPLL